MPPKIATLLTIVLILFLFIWESRKGEKVSSALWLPVMWMAITGTRFVGQWLNLGGWNDGNNYQDGSLIDALYFSSLIIIGICVLVSRRIILSKILKNNRWLVVFFCLLFPFYYVVGFSIHRIQTIYQNSWPSCNCSNYYY